MISYDLHGTWDSTNPYLGPYVNSHTNLTEIDRALELLWRNNVDPKKVVIGIGFYGRSFTLSNPSSSQADIQEIIDKGGAQVTTDKTAAVSYDDEETLKLKMDYANGKCLGGVMGTAIKALAKASGRTDLSKSLFAKAGECGASVQGATPGKRNFCCPPKNPPTCKTDATDAGLDISLLLSTLATGATFAFSFLSYGCPNKDKPKESADILSLGKNANGQYYSTQRYQKL
ncbi:chitinase [Colletotrichum cuscutae]|uniref:chitinase n=1 Tax=Colletotrichum cuscutae TaxID=1209917 RepID=A0AAI9VI32_9PEZI|nr:chitinase [Colletotrichum cuscutae]